MSTDERIEVTFDAVTPGYFQAVGTPLVLGRDFGPEDRADGLSVAIVNQAMVRRYWPDEEPIGKRFKTYETRVLEGDLPKAGGTSSVFIDSGCNNYGSC